VGSAALVVVVVVVVVATLEGAFGGAFVETVGWSCALRFLLGTF
jgi:hypothetical protein